MRVLQRKSQTKRARTRPRRSLRLTPHAWAKLRFLRDAGPTEIGCFGVSDPEDLLLVRDVTPVRQACSAVSVAFDDAAVADYFDQQADAGLSPQQFGRIWFHTHPGASPHPSGTDEATFARVFGPADWAVMAILARGGGWYARLGVSAGPGASQRLPVRVAWDEPFGGSDHAAWLAQYAACVEPEPDWDDLEGLGERLFGIDPEAAEALWSCPPD
ncbi:MPN domain-containing protein [Pirellulimonas nuda]|uniref:hypothetical protein n=1 Tax=Pirellulimonas nuda TaxID=2528009 RepID=UPI0011A44957|nr:hypothetical protein [Pirellulimonas nuda]